MPVVAGVDSSTQSCTVELRDADSGELLGAGTSPHPVTHPPRSEQDPEAWWSAFATALHGACAAAGRPARTIRALSVGAQCHGMVVLDSAGAVLRPAKLWNDTQSAAQAERLVAERGPAWWVGTTGVVPNAAHTVTKLAWLADNEPDHLSRLRAVVLPHDWMTYRLTGRYVTDRSDASGTAYYEASRARWRPDILTESVRADIDWAAALPEVLGPDEPAGPVRPEVAAELGLARDVLVGPGGGDQHLAALGLGLAPGDVAYSLGTSGVVLTCSADPVFDESGWVDGVADATGGYLPLVCTLNCTKVTDTFARLLGVTPAELGELALSADPEAPRPVLAAYLDGERTPHLPFATGMLGGLTTALDRSDLALAVFEGVVAGLVRGHRAIDGLGVDTSGVVVAVGGGARSAAYRQVIADFVGRPVVRRDAPEAVTRGAAVQAAAILRGRRVTDVRDEWVPAVIDETTPRPGPVDRRFDAYVSLANAAAARVRP